MLVFKRIVEVNRIIYQSIQQENNCVKKINLSDIFIQNLCFSGGKSYNLFDISRSYD